MSDEIRPETVAALREHFGSTPMEQWPETVLHATRVEVEYGLAIANALVAIDDAAKTLMQHCQALMGPWGPGNVSQVLARMPEPFADLASDLFDVVMELEDLNQEADR